MAKLLFVLSSDIYVRNYLRSGVIAALRGEHSVKVIADSRLALLDEVALEPGYLGSFKLDERIARKRELLFSASMWRFRKRSVTFFFRWLRMANWGIVRTNSGLLILITSFIRWLGSLLLSPRPLITALLGTPGIFTLSVQALSWPNKISESIVELLSGVELDAILFPSAAFEPVIPDLIRYGRANKVKTLTLIDNWDNLTSKTVYLDKPDHIAVWGEQAKSQARAIHQFEEAQIHLIGTPRFDPYFSRRDDSSTDSPYPFPFLLFVGSAMPFDELDALHSLESVLDKNPSVPANLRVVYRPHPWQQERVVPAAFRESDFRRTILDQQIMEAHRTGFSQESSSRAFQPALSYYPGLLTHATAVIGPLTTMLFEASLCLRPVLALSYADGHHFTTNRRYLTHFEGLENVPGFFFCDEQNQLEIYVSHLLATPKIKPWDSDAVTSHYLHRDQQTYEERLNRLVLRIISAR